MRPAALLVGADIVGAEHAALGLCHEDGLVGRGPVGDRILLGDGAVDGVGLARAEHRQDQPRQRRAIARRGGSDRQVGHGASVDHDRADRLALVHQVEGAV